MIAEFIREKILRSTHDEVPHAVGVAIDDMTYDDKQGPVHASGRSIYVERDSQKGIIIGKGGEMLKAIGTDARVDLERLLGEQGVPQPERQGEEGLAPGRVADSAVRLRRGR